MLYDGIARTSEPLETKRPEIHRVGTLPAGEPFFLTKGNDPNGPRFVSGFSHVELALRLEARPSMERARCSPDRNAKTIGFCVWQLRRLPGRGVVSRAIVRRRRNRDGEGDSARDKSSRGHPDDRFEHLAPCTLHGRIDT